MKVVIDMLETLFEIVNIAQLEVLGFNKEKQNIFLIFISLLIVSVMLKPVITFLTNKKYTFVLMYFMGSLMMITVVSLITFVNGEMTLLKQVFQSIILFGFTLAFYILYQLLKREEQK